jgi:spore germination protein GerM
MIKRHGWGHPLRRAGWLTILGLGVHLAMLTAACLAQEGDRLVANLYFADPRNPYLVAEARVVANPGDPAALGRRLIAALIDGPSEGNYPTIPKGTRLRSFFLLADGTAVVDFTPQFRENHPGSCRMEQLTLFSIVNSLILNVPEIRRVKILIDGAEAQTLAGHLALDFPLTADILLTR